MFSLSHVRPCLRTSSSNNLEIYLDWRWWNWGPVGQIPPDPQWLLDHIQLEAKVTKHSLLRVLCGREISSSKSLLRWLSHQIPSKYVVLVTFGCCDKMSYKGNLKKKAFILAYSLWWLWVIVAEVEIAELTHLQSGHRWMLVLSSLSPLYPIQSPTHGMVPLTCS